MVCARSVLSSQLFVMYINLVENASAMISQFADDTKFGGMVDSEEDCTWL